LSPTVRTLIRRHIHSVGGLELLMLLHAERDRAWRVDEICDALGCPTNWAMAQLDAMNDAGLVEVTGDEWRFAPASAQLEQATDALQDAYRLQSRDVVRFVFATPGRDLKEFSDAFRMRREED
jgi:predicted transcriptional regulator